MNDIPEEKNLPPECSFQWYQKDPLPAVRPTWETVNTTLKNNWKKRPLLYRIGWKIRAVWFSIPDRWDHLKAVFNPNSYPHDY